MTIPIKVLITGVDGQLGHELLLLAPSSFEVIGLDVDELDITQQERIEYQLNTHTPQIVINAAAYTAVDKAETEREKAYLVNATGVRLLVEQCSKIKSRLIHISTDFVFAGDQSIPYKTTDVTGPVSVYGSSKLAGEQYIEESKELDSFIVRTSWLYGAHGNNFVRTMLRLMREKDQLGIVTDQIGTPTWARSLAGLIWAGIEDRSTKGMFHWSDAGVASWYDFAVAIQEEAYQLGILKRLIPIKPLTTKQYPTPAERPHFSVMDKTETLEHFNIAPIHWRTQLRCMLKDAIHSKCDWIN